LDDQLVSSNYGRELANVDIEIMVVEYRRRLSNLECRSHGERARSGYGITHTMNVVSRKDL
jgi:hypothetical protein